MFVYYCCKNTFTLVGNFSKSDFFPTIQRGEAESKTPSYFTMQVPHSIRRLEGAAIA